MSLTCVENETALMERNIRWSSECLLVRRGVSDVTIFNRRREEVCRRTLRKGDRLRQSGVDSRLFFLGMHEQPVTEDLGIAAGEGYPVAERLAKRGLYLPSGLSITEEQVRTVAATVKSCLTRRSDRVTVAG